MLTEGVGSNGRTSGTQILKEAVERDLNVLQVLEVSRGATSQTTRTLKLYQHSIEGNNEDLYGMTTEKAHSTRVNSTKT